MDKDLLILNAISVCLHRDLFDKLNRNPFLYLHLDEFLLSYYSLHYLLNLDCFNLFFYAKYGSIHKDFDWNFNLLNYDLRNRNLNDLKYWLINYNDFLNDLGNLNYFLDDSRNHNYLFHNLLDLNHPRHFHNLLNDSINELFLNLHNFFLNNHRDWLLYIDRFNYLLPCWHYLYFLYLYLFDFFRHIRYINLADYWNLLGDVKWHDFLNLNIFCNQDFLDYRLVYKDFDLSEVLFFIAFDKVRVLDEYFFGYFFNQLLLNL